MNDITIGYLSWNNHNKFLETLISHSENSLFNYIPPQNRIIFFQEITDRDKDIATTFNCRYIGNNSNIGILYAFIELVEACNTKYFIFCENDFILMKQNELYIDKTLHDVVSILDTILYAQIKLSNSKNPGFLYITPSDIKAWIKNDNTGFRYKIESLSWIDNPEIYYPTMQSIHKNYKWLMCNNDDQLWSNHIYACNTKFLKEIIVPILKFNCKINPTLDIKYQGLEDTLANINQMLGKDPSIDKLIEEYKKRIILSGGGNFFHKKY